MEKKKFDTPKAVKNLFENLNDKETLLVLHDSCEEENGGVSVGYTDKRSVISAIAAIMTISLADKGASKGFDDFTDIILEAVKLVRRNPEVGMKLLLNELTDILKEDIDKYKADKKTQEEHPCEGCADILTCMDDDAIDYRKKHHMPKPKKGKKSK